MMHPQAIVLAFDDFLAKQLRPFIAEHRWVLQEIRQAGACATLLKDERPTVLIAQLDPHAPAGLSLVAEVHHDHPAVAIIAVSDVKMTEADRAAWTLAAFDLGARYVVVPPLARTIFEDLVGGLMAGLLKRSAPVELVIDLASDRAAHA